MKTITQPILFVGGGNMAYAIISGASQAGMLDPQRVGVIEPSLDRHSLYQHAFTDAQGGMEWLGSQGTGGVIVLAVKPQMLDLATSPLSPLLDGLGSEPMVMSILAGTRIEVIDRAFEGHARVLRVMPNTPSQIGLGMSAIAAGPRSTDLDIELAEGLFGSVGKSVTISEDLMDAFTAIAGSGPAYTFYLAEAMMEAATQLGFDRQQSQTIVRQTVYGSAALLDRSAQMPRELREQVTSKNGTTHAATRTLDESGVMDAIVRAIHSARHRGAELGKAEN
tara:strand:- start:279865 stop:280701 length:837 start_codon:yes stop_codon:yes gene_type:complete